MKFIDQLDLAFQMRKEAIWIKTEQEKEVVATLLNSLKYNGFDRIYDFEPSSGLYILDSNDKNNISKLPVDAKNTPGVKNGTSGAAVLSLYNLIQNDTESMELSAIILKDMDLLYNNYAWSRTFREMLEFKQERYTPIIVISPTHQQNTTLDHLFKEICFDSLSIEDIKELLCDYNNIRHKNIDIDEVCNYFVTYNKREIIEILDESFARYDKLNVDMLKEKKLDAIKSSGLLSYKKPNIKMSSVGGTHRFKDWFEETRLCMLPQAREVGLPMPKGYLALGVPGTAKSYMAEVIAGELDIPFLKLDMSKILTKFVGESERKISQARELIESCAPCVLLIDEVEKHLGGYASSNNSDSGTLARVFGAVLEMLNDNTNGIFTIMTSNNVRDLPPELTRAGRLDAIWYFTTPNKEERKEIFKVHLNKQNIKLTAEDLDIITEKTSGYTGAEIEQIVKNSMRKAFLRCYKNKKKFAVTGNDLIAAKNDVIPITVSSQEKIADLETWAKGRALFASESNNNAVGLKAIQSASALLSKK